MRDEVRSDFERSVRVLRDIVFPTLRLSCPDFQGMEIEVLLHHRDRLHYDLDTIAGIDAYLRTPLGLRTIAARVQYGGLHRTFTIRVARPKQAVTELHKRLSQVASRDSGTLYPYWTLHAYVTADGSRLSHAGLAKTSELYVWLAQQFALLDPREPHEPLMSRFSREGERFLVVPWDIYRASGHYFFEYSSHDATTARQ
ncbi:MAG TPA: hypothetical protein VFB60_17560 [Ktedonobacteraceae bacterium]|nr:hypothetical protein [Ktedonobacteraceae bacterium]